MRLNDFKLEVFFNKYEFTAPYLLAQSDCESMSIQELLSYEAGAEEQLKQLGLGYTEVPGNPSLRSQIARLYQQVDESGILVHVGAQEAIFNFMHVALEPGDHIICQFPIYQSLYEVAKSLGCEVSMWEIKQGENGWELDLDELKSLIQVNTKLIVVNTPNNPTGYTLNPAELQAITELARQHNCLIFSDEVYQGLEETRPTFFADLYENAVSLGVMSKAYGLAGLRVGWIATQNQEIYDKMVRFKHYTTICTSGPSEFLAEIALNHGDRILKRNREIIQGNQQIANSFFQRYPGIFTNNVPQSGPVAFHRIHTNQPIEQFCEKLVEETGVLLLPATVYDVEEPYIRMGYGRKSFAECLERFEGYVINRF
ncbi:aminotransferase class I/II-fold pyridoxal phosphate-dependent enzyme [Ammoniphilus sp. YIM 78166]|uniref:aminotransferase class I/II-fold pyridoxal phosphate-dependent enzyme n=1 Tax=Ammoniphilus sp. YIM 78166 TaxID=1644106 RepID=UPI00106FA755|nr:aminotransferase class I/II-fold pyridoxal phosphate-dependent enzyme [Ammoniphilus sp. YIM 78166]